jgi:hypothetical protein
MVYQVESFLRRLFQMVVQGESISIPMSMSLIHLARGALNAEPVDHSKPFLGLLIEQVYSLLALLD